MEKSQNILMKYKWIIALILTTCYSIQYMDRLAMGYVSTEMIADMNMSAVQFGQGMFWMLVFYGPMQGVVGAWCDRFGAKRVLLVSIVGWSILTFWLSMIQSYDTWFWRQIIFGLVCATEYVPSARIIARWFSKRQRAQASSVLSYAWILTPAWAPILVTNLVILFGSWRPFFVYAALFGLVPFLLILFFVHDRPEKKKNLNDEELLDCYEDELKEGVYTREEILSRSISEHKIAAQSVPLMALFKTKGWFNLCVAFIAQQALFWSTVTWIPKYLRDSFGFDIKSMGLWVALYFAAGVLGSFTGSRFSDRVLKGNRKPVIVFSFLATIPLLLGIAFMNQNTSPSVLMGFFIACGFIANCSWGPWISWPAEIFNTEVYAKALGIINALAYFFGAAGIQIVMPLLVVTTPGGGVSYLYSWIAVATIALAGGILVLFTKTDKTSKI